MSRSRKIRSRSIRLRREIEFTVERAPLRIFDSLRRLDADRLSLAKKARFEVGAFELRCCRRVVRAVVERGMVTKLELEPCERSGPLPPEWKPIVRAARQAVARGGGARRRLPMPVKRFLADAHALTIDIDTCFLVCLFGWCILCCYSTTDSTTSNGCSIFEDDWPVAAR